MVANVFINDIVRLHGVPLSIVTDRDSRFMTDFWKELHRLHGTELKFSTAYHPQTDGQSEALNRCLEMYLRCYVADNPKCWLQYLPWAEFWYNTSYHTSAQMTPFEILYGRKPPTLARYIRNSTSNVDLDKQLLERDEMLASLKLNLLKAQGRMKEVADKNRRDVTFEINDWVYVKIQPYRQGSIRLQRHHKLGHRYFGPYRIVAKIGQVAYKLDLPASARIHPVFHVSLLRKCIGQPTTQITPLHLVDSTSELLLQPAQVIQTRKILKGAQTISQSLVKWLDLPESDATWEDDEHLKTLFPQFHLEDKVSLHGGGNVTMPVNGDPANTTSTSDTSPTLEQGPSERPRRMRWEPKWMGDYYT